MRALNWKLILYLSIFGPIMGGVTLAGMLGGRADDVAWLVFTLVVGYLIVRRGENNPFAHGAMVGFLSGATATLIQGIFSELYVVNNPDVLAKYGDMAGSDRQYFFMMLVPFVGIGSALLGGMVTFFIDKMLGGSQESEE